ncbi:MAG: caspase family protein [Gemmatimonadales bacterium]|nr:caspase family protein [Gemmatimonadales bacterium]
MATQQRGNGRATVSRGAPKGLSLHIGLNHVDPSKYQDENGDPWDGELAGCINDARDMQAIAVAEGFRTTLFTDDQATSNEVIKTIARFATELTSGDILLLSYSGHGGQVPDVNGDDEDGQDETWCLFDRMVVDDELYNLWSQFQAGVRVFVLSDSCHSGTMLKQLIYSHLPPLAPIAREIGPRLTKGALRTVDRAVDNKALRLFRESSPPKYHNLPIGVQQRTYKNNKAMYDAVQWAAGRSDRSVIGATVLLISGCQDNQLSADGDENGLFTQTLLDVWSDGSFQGSYQTFADQIIARMPGTQTPNYYKVGAANAAFEAEQPFTIGQGANEEEEPATETSAPTITAESSSAARDGDAPRFQVSPGANSYYIVEVAADYDLFVNRPSDNTSEFYATYYDPDSPDRETGNSYTLPDHAWEALKGADQLYYRIGTTSSETGWDDYTVSTDDGVEPPSLEIAAAEERVPPKRGSKPVGTKSARVSRPPATSKPRASKMPPAASRTAPPRADAPSPWVGSSRSLEEAMKATPKARGGRKGAAV